MTGRELQQILLNKWGRSYDVQLRPLKGKMYCQIMWKYLEQASFPLSEQAYLERLSGIVSYLVAWGALEQVIKYLEKSRENPRVGKAVSIPLDLGELTSEWLIDSF